MAKGNERKLEELILHISQKCANDKTFGSIKLNKILCYSDFTFYVYNGHGITDVDYQKLANGPAPRRLVPVRDKMIRKGHMGLQQIKLKSGNVMKRPVNLREPDLSLFSGEEIAVVDSVIEWLKETSSQRVTEVSHELVGWAVAEVGHTIPYRTFYFSNPPLSEDEGFRARELFAKMRSKSKKSRDASAA